MRVAKSALAHLRTRMYTWVAVTQQLLANIKMGSVSKLKIDSLYDLKPGQYYNSRVCVSAKGSRPRILS